MAWQTCAESSAFALGLPTSAPPLDTSGAQRPLSIAGVVLQTLIQEAMVHQATERHLTSLAGGQQDRRRKMAAHIQTAAAVGPSSGGIRGIRTATADPFGAEAAGAQFAPRLGLQRALASKVPVCWVRSA